MPTTREQLDALSYTGNAAQAEGFVTGEYRAEYQKHGFTVRYWEAYRPTEGSGFTGPDGETATHQQKLLIEQDVDGVKVMLWDTEQEYNVPDFGMIKVGHTMVSCIPSELELAQGDRLLITEAGKAILDGCVLSVTGSTSVLPFRYPQSIVRVLRDGAEIAAADYTLSGNTITWDNHPTGDVLVRLRRYPMYEFLGTINKTGPVAVDGAAMPQRGALRLLQPEEEN